MDPLSDVLSLLKLKSYGCGAFDLGGESGLQFPQHASIKCYAVVSGEGWLELDGAEPVRLAAGDALVLPPGPPFRLTSDRSLPLIDGPEALAVRAAAIDSFPDTVCLIAGGHFALAGSQAELLLGGLPPIVLIQKDSEKAELRWCIEQMMKELRQAQPGSLLMVEHLAHMTLVQALRLHLKGGVGWLSALADESMRTAIQSIHCDPSHAWTVQQLAEGSGMSRSVFALRFQQTVGVSPMVYLTRWRMLLAGDRLLHSSEPVARIAADLGYDSESAFGKAFKRVMGCPPRRYVRFP